MSKVGWLISALGATGLGLLFVSHWVHALGFLPYAVLLACPLLHLFHRHHGRHRHAAAASGRKDPTP